MTDIPPPEPPRPREAPHAYLHVEREGDDRYRILSSDLETIGAQLRGKPRFSVFNSIILPVIVTIVTFMLTSLFQVISWENSINVQAALDQAVAATKTYDKAASEAEKRFYATLLFQSAVKNFSNRKTTVDTPLYQLDAGLQKQRFDDFYKELATWNQTYSQLLPDISYDIDRPVFTAAWTDNGYQIKREILNKVNCDVPSLADEIEAKFPDPNSRFALTNHFAVINKCFADNLRKFSVLKDEVLTNKDRVISDAEYQPHDDALYGVRVMLDQFRCYAVTRIHYLNARKDKTIIFANLFNEQQSIQAHFDDTKKRCK